MFHTKALHFASAMLYQVSSSKFRKAIRSWLCYANDKIN